MNLIPETKLTRLLLTPVALLVLIQCAVVPPVADTVYDNSLGLLSKEHMVYRDGRSRFREIFCAVLQDHGRDLPEYMPCEEALVRYGEEPQSTGLPVDLGDSDADYLIGLVPGLAWQCVREWLDEDNSAPLHVADYGYKTLLFEVDGLSSPNNNARQIRDYMAALSAQDQQRPIILIGHSKGAIDILQAIVSYPEVSAKVVAVVSLAGAIGGSPLAEETSQATADMVTHLPKSGCDSGDEGALASLHTQARVDWLANNTLPANIRYYSVIAVPDREHVSIGLKHKFNKLGKIDIRNDGHLLFYDQFIPGATLLAFANADHWAISTPVARQLPFIRATVATKSSYPREALFESILRYVEEDLGATLEVRVQHRR